MSDASGPRNEPSDVDLDVDVDVEAGRTVVRVMGEREAAVIVYSAAGERIYLPPAADTDDETDPKRPGVGDSPYEADRASQTPYGSSPQVDPSVGLTPTADGFRILHPEPVHDVRFLVGRQQ